MSNSGWWNFQCNLNFQMKLGNFTWNISLQLVWLQKGIWKLHTTSFSYIWLKLFHVHLHFDITWYKWFPPPLYKDFPTMNFIFDQHDLEKLVTWKLIYNQYTIQKYTIFLGILDDCFFLLKIITFPMIVFH